MLVIGFLKQLPEFLVLGKSRIEDCLLYKGVKLQLAFDLEKDLPLLVNSVGILHVLEESLHLSVVGS